MSDSVMIYREFLVLVGGVNGGRSKGLLYMNTLEHYVSLEGDAARNDPHEGVAYMLQGRGALFQIQNDDGVYQTIATVAGPIRSISDRDRATNVFCMYALR
jgi:hypothetical protein